MPKADPDRYRCYRCKRARSITPGCAYCGGAGWVPREQLTQAYLREIINYDRETGRFTWIKPTAGRVRPGEPAGTLATGPHGQYIVISIHGRRYQASQLAWLYVTGSMPADMVDHRDVDSLNNRWENLRQATNAENMRNTGLRSTNSTGLKGVSRCTQTGLFRAAVWVDGKRVHLGRFADIAEAGAAAKSARARLHGEFARHE